MYRTIKLNWFKFGHISVQITHTQPKIKLFYRTVHYQMGPHHNLLWKTVVHVLCCQNHLVQQTIVYTLNTPKQNNFLQIQSVQINLSQLYHAVTIYFRTVNGYNYFRLEARTNDLRFCHINKIMTQSDNYCLIMIRAFATSKNCISSLEPNLEVIMTHSVISDWFNSIWLILHAQLRIDSTNSFTKDHDSFSHFWLIRFN